MHDLPRKVIFGRDAISLIRISCNPARAGLFLLLKVGLLHGGLYLVWF